MIAWKSRPASAHASTYWATLNATLIACFVPATSPMNEAITCIAIAGTGPNVKKMANEKVTEATTSWIPPARATVTGLISQTTRGTRRGPTRASAPDRPGRDRRERRRRVKRRQPGRPLPRTSSRESFPDARHLDLHSPDAHFPAPMVVRAQTSPTQVTLGSTPLDASGVVADGDDKCGDDRCGGDETGNAELPFDLHVGRAPFVAQGKLASPPGAEPFVAVAEIGSDRRCRRSVPTNPMDERPSLP